MDPKSKKPASRSPEQGPPQTMRSTSRPEVEVVASETSVREISEQRAARAMRGKRANVQTAETGHIQSVIVPVHGKRVGKVSAGAASLSYGQGPLLTSVQVYTIFWGADWQTAPDSSLIDQLNRFFDAILASSVIDLLAEYGVAGQSIGHGSRIGSNVIATEPGAGTGNVNDNDIQQALQGWMTAGLIPAQTANSLYFVYLPPNVTVTGPNNAGASCSQFCGYHWYAAASPNIYYAVVPYPGCASCLGGMAQLDALTSVCSHELCESITDPEPWTGWNDPNNGEIGDICAWQTASVAGYTVQKEWSNTQGACAVAPAAQKVPGVGTSFGPTMASFNAALYMVWKGAGNDQGIWWTSFDGSKWQAQSKVPGVGTSVGPAAAPFNNRLFIAWKGAGSDEGIYWTSFDGNNWPGQNKVQGVGTSVEPALAAFNNRLYMAWKGAGNDEGIYWSSFDGNSWQHQNKVPGVGTSVGPALAALNNQVFMAWKGAGADEGIYWTSFDGNSWQAQNRIAGVGTSVGPALAAFNGEVYAAWKGAGANQAIWWSAFANGNWQAQQVIAGTSTSFRPAIAALAQQLDLTFKGGDGDEGIYWTVLRP
jgi:hypothetical protein